MVSRVSCGHADQALGPLLRSYSWLRHSDRSVINLVNEPRDTVSCLALDGTSFVSERDRQSSGPPLRFHIVEPSGTIQTLSRFNPLIYFSVFMEMSHSMSVLQLSLRSLAEHGNFCETLGVACDRSRDDLIKYIPEVFHDRLIVSEASKDRGWFNRYYLDHGRYDSFQPILYSDIDVIFDANINDL